MKRYLIYMLIVMMLYFPKNIMGESLSGYETYKKLEPYESLAEEGTLILSNSPETVKESGILYKDVWNGKGRIVFHHVNATGVNDKKLQVVIKNVSNKNALLVINKEGYCTPMYHYLEAGQCLLKDYLETSTSRIFFIRPNEQCIIYDSSHLEWKQQMVLSGMLDVYASKKLEVTFAVMQKGLPIEAINQLKPLEMDLAPRGTFNYLTKCQCVWIDGNQDTYYLIEDEQKDWLIGVDALTGRQTINYGNYGLIYKIKIIAGEDLTVFVCPRGGIFQGIVRWEDGQSQVITRKHAFKIRKERVDIGNIKKGEARTLEYILPNGSAAPVLIGFDVKN